MKRSIFLVFAHPDDESTFVGGTVLKYTSQGIPVDLVCATRGEKGTRLDVSTDMDLGTVREAQLRTAAALIGIRNIYLLSYIDGELDIIQSDDIIHKILEIMQLVQPQIIITFGPDGITGHSDHVVIGNATTKAFEALAVQNWSPRKLYYVTIPESVVPNPGEIGIITRPDDKVTTTINIRSYLEMKIRAVSAHSSQQDSREFSEMLRQNRDAIWANNEFLYLVNAKASDKETDLFQ
jgi:LmbE family N-acetylglucosaminyl deacetylase